jgi:aspartyl-tRNA(Asn)/glutamyl-tRNA(Gln) amidotransferase subunit B
MHYEVVIGMEVHAELSTRSKVFCGCPTTFGTAPNTQICPVCIGMPGVLPVLNRTALEYAVRAAIALHCHINKVTTFDRKNYYYPDLPKNYQISQNYQQLGVDGYLVIPTGNGKKRIGIINVHLEEDAGKLLHPEGAREEYSLVDLNRSGLPLLEIVSAPDMRSLEEAFSFMTTLKNFLQYLEVSDCKMQEGSLRFEINTSLRPKGTEQLGTKVEIKNLNSMKIALKAIEYEIRRQTQMLDEGGRVVQETRLWDDLAGVTRAMRTKEFAQDYRYFPEPDLVEVHIGKNTLEEARRTLPELQEAKKERFMREYGIPEYDAQILTSSKALADYYEQCLRLHASPKSVSNWIMTEVLRELNEREIEPDEFSVTPQHLAALVRVIDDGTISGKIAKTIFAEMVESGKMPDQIVREKGLVQISDVQELETLVERVIAENQDAVEQVRKGKDRAIGFLVGQIMKATRGKANPRIVNDLLKKKIQ